MGERYKMVTKESKGLLKGEYGKLPASVNEEVRAKAGISPDEVISCRPADLIEPEMDKYRNETAEIAKSDEDVLSYALFPQVAPKFFDVRDGRAAAPEAAPKAEAKTEGTKAKVDENGVRILYVDDCSNK